MTTRIAIVDDHNLLAETLASALSNSSDLVVVGTYTSAQDCIDALRSGIRVDVLMTDYSMPGLHGIDLCQQAKKILPDLKCVLLTMHDSSELRFRARRADIDGFLMKTRSISEISSLVLAIAQGRVMDYESLCQADAFKPGNVELSPAEIEVIRCIICQEMSSKEAAEFLHRSQHTIEQHRKNIYAKLGIDSVQALTKYAIEVGICMLASVQQTPLT